MEPASPPASPAPTSPPGRNGFPTTPSPPAPASLPATPSGPELLRHLDYAVVQQCMHCGLCLPTCPTFVATKEERHGPRGRIALMRAVADGELAVNAAFGDEMYSCLGCLACVTACPAGVDYARLFEAARAQIETDRIFTSPARTFWRSLTVKFLFMRPWRLRLLGRLLWLYQASGLQRLARALGLMRLLPARLRALEPSTPTIRRHFSDALLASVESPPTPPRWRVGLLTGCVQDLILSEVNRDTADVLLAHDCEVVTPRDQGCCGSLHGHNGEPELARTLARRLIDRFDLSSLDAIISNAGGCGSHLAHYDRLLADDPDYAEKARLWSAKFRDIHAWLIEIGPRPPGPLAEPAIVTYHPSCHLHHGQGVKTQPETLLRLIPNLTLVPLPDATVCCGSAGIYNITRPEMAGQLQRDKTTAILTTPARIVATANPGCHLQIENGLRDTTPSLQVRHPLSLLAEAYRHASK